LQISNTHCHPRSLHDNIHKTSYLKESYSTYKSYPSVFQRTKPVTIATLPVPRYAFLVLYISGHYPWPKIPSAIYPLFRKTAITDGPFASPSHMYKVGQLSATGRVDLSPSASPPTGTVTKPDHQGTCKNKAGLPTHSTQRSRRR